MINQTLRRRMLTGAATALLAACSGGTEPAPEASASASAAATPSETASAAAMPSEAAPSPSASASPSATPSPTASASAKAPAPTPSPTPEKIAVAAAPPPASWARCAVCHAAEKGAPDKIGPNLYGVYGHKMGQGSYAFSDALKSSGLTLDEATLDKWLENPRALVPGNRMSFPGLKDAAKRAEIIAYLKQQR
ncbi:c-type cytochrome [Novosphingobium sp. MMS21-SN21R]|uniref:c-type cytochrome n=1 Tax=Novosphingobium sp. MMS21-SN21R TaxID=2969298 RepID=UPI002884F7A2|nr:c-type cytochrome [Novosphingobium sp. MMS21-SN21R]MDT0510041.1 hypothetical protein [Novosphingobium sp. MMS21-SN21R]